MMLDNYDLAQTIAIVRQDIGLSQTKLGEITGVSRQTISAIENGNCDTVSFGTIKKLVDALGYELKLQHAPNLPVNIMGHDEAKQLWQKTTAERNRLGCRR